MEYHAADAQSSYPKPLAAWWIVIVLVLAYIVSFVDRQILGLLVQDLRQDLAISDTEVGLLQGPAFGVIYAAMGLPFGWLADRTNRFRLIALGMLLWTVMTMLGGLADSFGWLFITRMGVGVGEAALVPAAVSLLADSFPPNRRSMPLAVFTAGASAGAGLALILGGALIAFARGDASDLPLIGKWLAERAPWQAVLLLAGGAGLPVALLVLMLPDPGRRSSTNAIGGEPEMPFFAYLARHRRLFILLLSGSSLLYLFANALSAWLPSFFVRGFDWDPAAVGVRLGTLILVGALTGNIISGMIADSLVQRGKANGTLLTMCGGAFLLVPTAILGPLAPTATLAQIAVPLIYFAIALCFGIATATFVAITPPLLRGQMIALYLLLGNLVGLGLGPPSTGLVIEHVINDPSRVGAALSLVAAVTVAIGAALLCTALRLHRARALALSAE